MERDAIFALDYALNRGFQIHPDAMKILENVDVKELEKVIKEIIRTKSKEKQYLINQSDLEVLLGFNEETQLKNECEVLSNPTLKITSAEGVTGYNALFGSRFSKLKKIISNRPESKLVKPIATLKASKINSEMFLCGLVSERRIERNITRLVIDDPSGSIEIIVFDKDLRVISDSLLTDQFVMVKVILGKNGGFISKDIFAPDIPDHKANRSETETYTAFLSDLHIGSRFFMENELREFISWLSSPDPIARKVKFVIICGDVVDGIGIYPGQDKELENLTIHEQLGKAYEILSKIPMSVKVIISPGNHDPGRRALPQPAIPEKYYPDFWTRSNFIMVGNPAVVSLNGVKVLLFHGQSIDDIVRTTPGLSYDKPTKIMRQLLRARHLSPIYGSQTPLAPESEDMMIIDDIPDIFHTGHVHVVELDLYKGILLLNSGAWQRQTDFQASVGITPTPGLVVLVNLKNFKVYTKDFKNT